ncbi:hypothetical protein GCM10027046_00020 [Uliginosibacterium flavum]|uniref:Type I-U CRISPR-associated helicase/endonuclease Cas3 n=1 Tax=Uliginosibacterium flavum TaxID=1396831 RepID=A0ABV2TH01_9RHOO
MAPPGKTAPNTFQDELFNKLSGVQPYRWQKTAFDHLVRGDIPDQIKAPTAAGKTMILPTFVAALAAQASAGSVTLPRRLVYVVNRRVLVDEATRLCERIREIILDDEASKLTAALRLLSASGVPLAISTLRGAFEDNGEWSADPSTPALILATPDMLGSRLLFRGYGGLGRNRAPMQAGLLGIDTLVVHDESHLARPFTKLLREVERRAEWQAERVGRPPLRIIEMTATLSPESGTGRSPIECNPADDPRLHQRMLATKHLRLEPVDNSATRVKRIVERVRFYAELNKAVAVFVSSPDEAAKIERAVSEGSKPALTSDRVAVLTGTMRGVEREMLLQKPVWRRLAADRIESEDQSTAVLIATGAGEIGIDLDADILLCDDSTLDRQIQRIGRCNRRGMGAGQIHIFALDKVDLKQALSARRACASRLLQTLPETSDALDASPLALTELLKHPEYAEAIDPSPVTRDLEDGILGLFASTSCRLKELSAPDPAIWIHGLIKDQPEISLVWRMLPTDPADYETWLEAWPIHRSECAKLPLTKLNEMRIAEIRARAPSFMLDSMGALLDANRRNLPPGGIVVFDCLAGGLTAQGLPNSNVLEVVSDASVHQFENALLADHSVRFDEEDGVWQCGDTDADTLPSLISLLHPGMSCAWYEISDGQLRLWLRQQDSLASDCDELLTAAPRLLVEHLDLAARAARRIAHSLTLPSELRLALVRSAHIHDQGKARTCWQHAVGNFDPARPLGKSGKTAFNLNANMGYRHELGSLHDCEDTAPLVRELVATHHGYARPTVRKTALIHSGCKEAAMDAAHGFAYFSRDMGFWGIAYLEALLKCSDVMAETQAQSLLNDERVATEPLHAKASKVSSEHTDIPFRAENLGEYLAALGLLWLADQAHTNVQLSWGTAGCRYHGIDDTQMMALLKTLAHAEADVDLTRAACMDAGDQEAGVPGTKTSKYPPLILNIGGHPQPLNAWCNERFSDKSSWKLAAGRSDALQTLQGMLKQCSASLSDMQSPAKIRDVVASKGLTKTKVPGAAKDEAQRFRYDAATSWTALDVGWSPYEEHMSFSRPWIEVLAAFGIQAAFPPPARRDAPYFTWSAPLPLLLARIAARGLMPTPLAGYQPCFESAGQNLDTYPSIPLALQGATACPQLLIA